MERMRNSISNMFLHAVLVILIAVCAVGLIGFQNSYAAKVASGSCGDDLTWVLNDDGTLIISGTGEMSYEPFRSITYQIKTVNIEDGVTNIGASAFYDCSSLKSITIPDSVASIGRGAFRGCSSLESITIPDSATIIDESTFSGCSSLKSITIPDSVTSINHCAFYGCSSITSITIPGSVKSFGENAFSNCSSLESITIPASVTRFESDAFTGCSSLTSISVEEGNPVYDSRENCNAIIETETNRLITGGNNTTIPNSVTSIGFWAFCDYSSLKSITIPNSVTSIEGNAFNDCSSLTSITIPASVTSIDGNNAFNGCISLSSISVEEGNPVYDSRDNCNAIIETETNSLITGCNNTTIPSSVTSIGSYAFFYRSSLKNITIPDSVTSIGESAFDNCSSLKSITIPNSVTTIGECAFAYCSSLKSITFPDSVMSVGGGAFMGCSNLEVAVFLGDAVRTPSLDDGGWCCFNSTASGFQIQYNPEGNGWTSPTWKGYPAYPHEHTWNDKHTIDKPATYTEEGSQSIHCSVCDSVKESSTVVIPKLMKENTMTAKAAAKTVKAKKLKKKALKVTPITVADAQGDVTYIVTGGKTKAKKALKVNAKTGKVIVKKKTKKGTYKIKVNVTASGNEEYKATSKTVNVTIKVR